MKVSLTIAERISLFEALPQQGSILTLRTITALREQLAFTDKERQVWKIEQKETPQGLMMVWDFDFNKVEVEFDINDATKGLIYVSLEKLSNDGQLRMEMISLYEKFVEGKKSNEVVESVR